MHVTQRVKAGRRIVSTLLVVLALLLGFPPAARADHGLQPDASCGFTGVKTLVLRPGAQLPLPVRYENLTSVPWTFYYIVTRNDLPFNLPGELLSPALGSSLTLPPFSAISLPGLGFTIPLSTTVGRGRITYSVFANFIGGGVSRIVNPANCEYDLTVQPLFPIAISGEPSGDH
jgi:hypothetical protein